MPGLFGKNYISYSSFLDQFLFTVFLEKTHGLSPTLFLEKHMEHIEFGAQNTAGNTADLLGHIDIQTTHTCKTPQNTYKLQNIEQCELCCQVFSDINLKLVGGFNHLEKYYSMGRIIPYIMENNPCLKPPTSYKEIATLTVWWNRHHLPNDLDISFRGEVLLPFVAKTMSCLPSMTGNGKHTTKNGDFGDGLLLFYLYYDFWRRGKGRFH